MSEEVCSVCWQGWLGQAHSHSTAPKSLLSKQESPAPCPVVKTLQGAGLRQPFSGGDR